MRRFRPHPLYPGAALCFAVVAFLEKPLADRRPLPPQLTADIDVFVTSSRDGGTGSLREAIFTADRARDRVRIEIRAGRGPIVLETALPPLVNPEGVVVEAPYGAEIDGTRLPAGALLDIDSPRSEISGLELRGGAGQGVLVRSKRVTLRGLTLTGFEEGVHVLEGAGNVTVQGSRFEKNGTGIGVDPDVPSVDLHDNTFRGHDKAAVWAVSPSPASRYADTTLRVRQNRFEEDRLSIVLINVAARVEGNQFQRPIEAAIYATGSPVLRGNRVDASQSVGIFADDVDAAVVEENEVSNSLAVGILVRQSRSAELRRNKVFGNAYGIAVILDRESRPSLVAENLVLNQRFDGLYVVGSSPVVQANRILGNRLAGLRALDYIPLQGPRVVGDPVLRDNVLRDNGSDETLRGEYREPREPERHP